MAGLFSPEKWVTVEINIFSNLPAQLLLYSEKCPFPKNFVQPSPKVLE
jgi:hypothetical protein